MTESAPDAPGPLEAVFVVNLVQDVNILRPLVIMARRDFGWPVKLLVAGKFSGRDIAGTWQTELEILSHETGCRIVTFEHEYEALSHLRGCGLIFAASESNLPGHAAPHDLMRVAPPGYLRITLQHGFECVGFRHSAAHALAHGPDAGFGADLVCAWFDPAHLSGTVPAQRSKLVVTGPTTVLQQFRPGRAEVASPPAQDAPGLVCENLHSVRMSAMGDFKLEFVDVFTAFCEGIRQDGQAGRVSLRPHPGGQFVLRNKVPLPANATIENAPMYRLDLSRFAYGISAPSSVLVDMVLAGLPTAVWRDRAGQMDTDNYADLPSVSSVEDWLAFARRARAEPEAFVAGRTAFLERFGLVCDPAEVHARYASIFSLARDSLATLSMAQAAGGVTFAAPPASTV